MNGLIKKLALAGALSAAALTVGCRDSYRDRDVDVGTGGSGTVGDGKVGRHDGVLNDGEGPLEENHDARIGDQSNRDSDIGRRDGVINDGEGPLEENKDPRKDSGKIGDGKVGQHDGVLNDGEGPLENNR